MKEENRFGLGVLSGALVTGMFVAMFLFGTAEGKQMLEGVSYPGIPYSVSEKQVMDGCLAYPEAVWVAPSVEVFVGCSLVIHDARGTPADRARAYYVRGMNHSATLDGMRVALEDLNAGLALKPADAWKFYFGRAVVTFLENQQTGKKTCSEEALADFSIAAEQSKGATESSTVFDGRAHCRIARGEVIDAFVDLEQAATLDPENTFAYRSTASIALSDAHKEALRTALWATYAKRAPADRRVQEAYFTTLFENEEYGKAVDLCTRLLESDVLPKYEVLHWRGMTYQKLHEFDKARIDLKEVVVIGDKLVSERQAQHASAYSEADWHVLTARAHAEMLLESNSRVQVE